jgi:hypothetical protein
MISILIRHILRPERQVSSVPFDRLAHSVGCQYHTEALLSNAVRIVPVSFSSEIAAVPNSEVPIAAAARQFNDLQPQPAPSDEPTSEATKPSLPHICSPMSNK